MIYRADIVMNARYNESDILPVDTELSVPRIVYGQGVMDTIVEPEVAAQTLLEVGVPYDVIGGTAVYLGSGYNLSRKGLQLSGGLDRIMHGQKERNQAAKYVIRVNTMLRGEPRTAEAMNRTLVHEGVHVAQAARRDPRLLAGNMALWGIAGLGAAAGHKLNRETNNALGLLVGPVVGFAVGHSIGYQIAPHEREARRIAETVTSQAIQRV